MTIDQFADTSRSPTARVTAAYRRITEVDRPEVWITLREQADVVVNLISDADQALDVLPIAADLAKRLGKPTINDPDKILRQTDQIAATADSGIVDECSRWHNLARTAIDRKIPNAQIVNLGDQNEA